MYKKNDYLEHHGIKGQRWYVRRFQNEDGTLTPAGRKRYAKIMDKQSMKTNSYTKTSDLVAKTLPAGMKIRRITTADDTLNNRLAYFSYTKADKYNLRSITPWLMDVRGKTINDAVEKNYTLNTDIKIPSQKEVNDIMKSIIKDPKERRMVNKVAVMDRWFRPGSLDAWYIKYGNNNVMRELNIKSWVQNDGVSEEVARKRWDENVSYCKKNTMKKLKKEKMFLKISVMMLL